MDRVYTLYRIERILYKCGLIPLAITVRAVMRIIFACDIPYKTQIGKNTKFPHDALGVVIHPDAIIGERCQINQGVTIGGRNDLNELPKIGNGVLIGANATVLGDIVIGDNSIIGAGSVVVKSVDADTVVAGNPARVLRKITG